MRRGVKWVYEIFSLIVSAFVLAFMWFLIELTAIEVSFTLFELTPIQIEIKIFEIDILKCLLGDNTFSLIMKLLPGYEANRRRKGKKVNIFIELKLNYL